MLAGPAAVETVWFPGVGPGSARAGVTSLVCFSYAGGTPSAYRGWEQALGGGVRVVPVLLAGRCQRLDEQPATSLPETAAEIADALARQGHTEDYAIFGHSMGALLGYEVACALRERGAAAPVHVFVSGSKAPHRYGGQTSHLLPDADLAAMVHDLGGLGEDHETARLYLERRMSVLRADLLACETYRWAPRPPLAAPMTAFCGSADPVATAQQADEWREYVTRWFVRADLPGDHFFLTGRARPALLNRLRRELCDPGLSPDRPTLRTAA